MTDVGPLGECLQDHLLVLRRELVLVALPHELLRGIHEQDAIVLFRLLENDDAGFDVRPEEQVGRELDDGVDIVVLHQVLADLSLRGAAVEHARELDDRRRPIHRQPGQHVHGEGQVRLRLWGQHARRGEAWVVDESRIVLADPLR